MVCWLEMMSTARVGIIANPAAGKDIRRLVAQGRFVPDHEVVNVLRRVLAGLEATGVAQVVAMPDASMLGTAASDGTPSRLKVELLEMPVLNEERDSTNAAELMSQMGVECIVTVGGDGTNRAVAKGSGDVPLVPISTGTNNVFPYMVEGTVAGLAAGVVAQGLVDIATVSFISKVLEVHIAEELRDIAVVDVAVSKQSFVGARAIWDVSTLHEVFLARAEAASIGFSAIGSRLRPAPADGTGLHILIGEGGTVVDAPVAPGVVSSVPVHSWSELPPGKPVEVSLKPCTIALDGERSFSLEAGRPAYVTLSESGPRVVSVDAAMRQASQAGVFVDTRRP